MKQQKISRNKPAKKPVTILDDRTPKEPPQIALDPSIANKPVRSVNYVEVGDMPAQHVQYMVQELNATYDSAKGGLHYFIPVRHGKIGSDIVFEDEFLKTVKEVCEIKDDEIILKGGAKEVHVVRRQL